MKTLLITSFMLFVGFNAFAIEEKQDTPSCEKLASETRVDGKDLVKDAPVEKKDATATQS